MARKPKRYSGTVEFQERDDNLARDLLGKWKLVKRDIRGGQCYLTVSVTLDWKQYERLLDWEGEFAWTLNPDD